MARECTLVFETETPIPFTCADGTGIEKGTILKITDLMTCEEADGDGDPIAGIAAEEKIASDGKVKIGVYRGGIFKGYCGSGGATFGLAIDTDVSTGDTNELVNAPVTTGNYVGIAMETATDGETFLFELRPHHQTANS